MSWILLVFRQSNLHLWDLCLMFVVFLKNLCSPIYLISWVQTLLEWPYENLTEHCYKQNTKSVYVFVYIWVYPSWVPKKNVQKISWRLILLGKQTTYVHGRIKKTPFIYFFPSFVSPPPPPSPSPSLVWSSFPSRWWLTEVASLLWVVYSS